MFQLVGEVPFLQSCSRKAASVMHVVFETSSRRLTSQKPGEEPLNFHEGLQGPERRRFWHHKLKHLGRLQCYGVARIIFKVGWGGGCFAQRWPRLRETCHQEHCIIMSGAAPWVQRPPSQPADFWGDRARRRRPNLVGQPRESIQKVWLLGHAASACVRVQFML